MAAATALVLGTAVLSLIVPGRSGSTEAAAAVRLARGPYQGLGTWVDMYSWSDTFTKGSPHFGLADVDAMAAAGVQTLYIQAASQTGPATVLEPDRLVPLIRRAHRLGISVVVWYFPTLVNRADDMTRLLQISRLPAEGVAVDIESTEIADIGQRNAALISLSRQLRRALPGRPLGAIVLPATLLEVVNTSYWPNFPYVALARSYDAWLPMVYWTGRLASSGFRDGYRYTADSVRRLRADLGPAGGAPVNPIAGVSVDSIGLGDMTGFVHAVRDTGSVGGSIYEWPGSAPTSWSVLKALRA
ncbi:MAG: hypothetical protein M3083_06370 [Actinomycetota bacterium]|nr:hypothetical protein [Actinomycetota bacterium]